MQAQYKFIVRRDLTVEDGGNFSPNRNLLSFLKYYLNYSNSEIQANIANHDREKVRELEMLGLLLWNYFFSRGMVEPSDKIKKLFQHAQSPNVEDAQFAIEFNEDADIDYKLLPWELLCWPIENDRPEKKHCPLFQNERIRLIRVGKPLPKEVNFTIPDDSRLRILFCVAGMPYDPLHYERPEEPIETPLHYTELASLKDHCKLIKSDLLVKLNGSPEELYIDGTRDTSLQGNPYFPNDFFELSRLRNCILKFKPHVIHLVTHGDCDDEGQLRMAFNEGENGFRLKWQEADQYLQKVMNELEEKPKLVFLQVCKSGQSSFPISLSEEGVPVIAAMFYDINQLTAGTMATNFYTELLGKMDTVGEAFHQSRLKCWEDLKSGNLGFGLPVIYNNIDKEDQPLITNSHLLPKTDIYSVEGYALQFWEKYNQTKKTSADLKTQQRGLSMEERYVKSLSSLLNYLKEDAEDDTERTENLQKSISILFSKYMPGDEFLYLKAALLKLLPKDKTDPGQRNISFQPIGQDLGSSNIRPT